MTLLKECAHYWTAQLWSGGLQVTILVVLVYAISRCFRRFPAQYRYVLWLLVLVRLALPTSIRSPLGMGQYPERLVSIGIQWLAGAYFTSPQSAIVKMMFREAQVGLARGNDEFDLLLFLGWISGMFLFGLAIGTRILQFHRRTRALHPVARPDVIAVATSLTGRLGLRDTIKLLQADNPASIPFPVVHGIVRPIIILPSDMAARWTAHALEPVLLHELTHIKRRDCLVNAMQMLLQVVYFYHPLVWLANWMIRRERELACDDDVVRRSGGCPTDYVRSMLQAAETVMLQRRQQFLGIAMAENFSDLGGRVRRMMSMGYRANRRPGFIYFAAVIVLGFFCLAVSCKGPGAGPRKGPDSTAGPYVVGNGVKPPTAILQPLPAYTEEARQARAEGIVLLQAVIRKDGSVDSMKILKGLGYGLDESAMNTIATKWRFKPGTLNDAPVDVQANIEVSFRLY